ncbi:histidine kinase [Pedobacter sp. PACM 27299]|uniref:NAD(P)-dependent oxidoreductase n=1 Tax=Pedobacter sp. PACM 27299 TaxID=1727164 RepID=UPI000705B164|nr:NAD(P)H-binding protein [Pedobacter sp. PACM 27299]ALL08122.1 histidine kinase [Pedobacter sp. PACM 27299]
MKVSLIGASGFVGAHLLTELLNRGHQVTGIVRNAAHVKEKNVQLTVKAVDVLNTVELAEAIKGSDAVISAFNAGWTNPNLYDDFLAGSEAIQKAVKDAGVPRLIVIGGAGSLFINDAQLVDGPDFPADYKAGATAARDYLTILKNEEAIDWTFFSPAIEMHPGITTGRTGQYRVGTESPVFDEAGRSSLSVQDLSVAIVDELEKPQYIKQRFTAGY